MWPRCALVGTCVFTRAHHFILDIEGTRPRLDSADPVSHGPSTSVITTFSRSAPVFPCVFCFWASTDRTQSRICQLRRLTSGVVLPPSVVFFSATLALYMQQRARRAFTGPDPSGSHQCLPTPLLAVRNRDRVSKVLYEA